MVSRFKEDNLMDINSTPRAERLNIGIFGRRNSGKSSLLNFITNQATSIVSSIAGTTTDPVYKAMELPSIGPVVWIDTAGFDDRQNLIGDLRRAKTSDVLKKCDIALLLISCELLSSFQSIDHSIPEPEYSFIKQCRSHSVPLICVISKADICQEHELIELNDSLQQKYQLPFVIISSNTKHGLSDLFAQILRIIPESHSSRTITGNLAEHGDTVLLIMPQDTEAPKDRLILPQVQTIRELLDKHCVPVCCTAENIQDALASLNAPPDLIITDSQVFPLAAKYCPEQSKLTSFSILFAAYKGDIAYFKQSAEIVESLTEESRILIAEACTHAALNEDIGKVKIPALLRKRLGNGLRIDFVSGTDFPEDLSQYDLIIHCGACMFNQRYVQSRLDSAKNQNIPLTNYGIILAYLNGILNKVSLPSTE